MWRGIIYDNVLHAFKYYVWFSTLGNDICRHPEKMEERQRRNGTRRTCPESFLCYLLKYICSISIRKKVTSIFAI